MSVIDSEQVRLPGILVPVVRSIAELTDVEHPAWPDLFQQVSCAQLDVRLLVVDVRTAREVLYRLQVSARSTLGAIALNCGGLVIDHGWLRILGGSGEGLIGLSDANNIGDPTRDSVPPPYLKVAFDVLGGQFAVNGGGLQAEQGEVCYFGPDTLSWSPIGGDYTQFIAWALSGGLDSFYEALRWTGWEQEVAPLALTDGIAVYPFLFTEEGSDLDAVTRSVVPYTEVLQVQDDLLAQLEHVPDGEPFNVRTVD